MEFIANTVSNPSIWNEVTVPIALGLFISFLIWLAKDQRDTISKIVTDKDTIIAKKDDQIIKLTEKSIETTNQNTKALVDLTAEIKNGHKKK